MQVNNLIQYLDRSELISSVSESEILPLVKEFPYCQTGHLLYAVHLNNNNSILFEEHLKKAATYCSDRIKLFEHLHPVAEEIVVEEEPLTETTKEEKFIPVAGKDELDVLEKEYLSQAISSSIIIESDTYIEQLDDIEEAEKEKEVNLFNENTEHTFLDWLKHYNGDEIIGENKGQERSKKEINQDIINRFIQEDPKIEPQKTKFYSPTDMARLSVTDTGFVSETLALIHVEQGNFQEAIKTYEKLSLKNPKKRSYFAAQIKILNKKLKP